MSGRQIPDLKLCVGVPRSVGRNIECITCERRIVVFQSSGPNDFYRCGYCTGYNRAYQVAEFVLRMPDNPTPLPGAYN